MFLHFSANGSCRVSLAVPLTARLVVLFSSGPWGERICVNAELNDADRIPITIGKLTPYNKWVGTVSDNRTQHVFLYTFIYPGKCVVLALFQ